jgi:hypothetical protein
MELDQTLGSRDMINRRMREVIEDASIGWGVDVTRVELQAIEPPSRHPAPMELVMRAERERRAAVTNAEAGKRAAILESEGQREAQVRTAEGEKEAAILRAEGLAAARLAMAQAEAEAIQRITASLPEGQAAMYLLGLKYLEALPAITQGKGTTIFLPVEATGVMGALGGMKELLARTAGEGAATGGSNQPVYQPPAARPAFKSLASPGSPGTGHSSYAWRRRRLSWPRSRANAPALREAMPARIVANTVMEVEIMPASPSHRKQFRRRGMVLVCGVCDLEAKLVSPTMGTLSTSHRSSNQLGSERFFTI